MQRDNQKHNIVVWDFKDVCMENQTRYCVLICRTIPILLNSIMWYGARQVGSCTDQIYWPIGIWFIFCQWKAFVQDLGMEGVYSSYYSPGAAGHLQMADMGFCQWLLGILWQCYKQHWSLVEVYWNSSTFWLLKAIFSFLDFAVFV